ncbi:MAG: hypothetical protein EZS28_034370 [Streblomastix strix]|uniref:RRM domain-containing protein n=1 Tax=Streblomastix strix TaxID=222440 RepID=A0A5J4UIQ9_9EUKA|nr:MAG: hypothetical protein EZS28_034370 [Streblomastix strix]
MTTEVSLKQIFIAFNISNCRIPQNQPPKKPRHGFLNFSTEQDAQNALQSIQGKIIDGNRITINYKHIKQEKKPKVKKQQDIKGIKGINNVDEQECDQDDSDDDINDVDDEKSQRSENLSSFKSEDEKKGSKFLDDLNEIMSVVSVDRVTVIRVYMEHGKDVAETINYLIDHPQ